MSNPHNTPATHLPIAHPPPAPAGGAKLLDVEDDVRRLVMYITIGIFGLTVLFACIAGLFFDKPSTERIFARTTPEDRKLARELEEAPFDHLKQILQILLPAETALLGSATGFYFGAKSKSG
jgi:hypothetical protein